MPRQVRVQYPGAIYHVMSRGDRREDIFIDDVDRQDFLKTLAEACQNFVASACLLPYTQSFPPRPGNTGSKPGPWHELAPEHLHHPAQPPAPALRLCL